MEQGAEMMLWIRTGENDKSRKSGMVWEKIIEGVWWWKQWRKKKRCMGHEKWNWEASSD